jgi:hypothetical protein
MSQTSPDTVLSHWSTLVENFQTSPLGFYQAVEIALKRRNIPETENIRVDYKEGGLLSASREYLHVTREKLVFDICGAPFGTGFFFSWWFAEERPKLNPFVRVLVIFGFLGIAGWMLLEIGIVIGTVMFSFILGVGLWIANQSASEGQFNDDIIRTLPILGTLYLWLFKPGTYYRIDSMEMFQQAVHNAVLEVIDQMTTEKGLRSLSELDRKPVMERFYDRKAR